MQAGVHIVKAKATKDYHHYDKKHQSAYKPECGQTIEDTAPKQNLGPAIERRGKVEA